ncbi:MAG TPA: shikimate kinase [Blastocatellia bacterium]|nr:shikimate kinase [Blastocatellia bacterium]
MNHTRNSARTDEPIFLVGFMGAGKTTVGQSLAKELGYEFIDLDDVIAAKTGKSVQQIFLELGEAEFRRLETNAIVSCRGQVRSVVALGGGAYVSKVNRDVLREIGKTIWLECPLEVCLRRVRGDQSRPLLGDEQAMKALLDNRRDAYSQADYAINSAELAPEQLAKEIVRLLRG